MPTPLEDDVKFLKAMLIGQPYVYLLDSESGETTYMVRIDRRKPSVPPGGLNDILRTLFAMEPPYHMRATLCSCHGFIWRLHCKHIDKIQEELNAFPKLTATGPSEDEGDGKNQ